MRLLSLAVSATVFGLAAQAQQVLDGASIGTGVTQNETVVLGDSHYIIHAVGLYEPMATIDPANPLTGLPGKCFGSIEIRDGVASGGGHCVYAEADARVVVTDWQVTGMTAEGALTGQWSIVGGGGAATGLTGAGEFSNLSDPATGRFTNRITGTVTLP